MQKTLVVTDEPLIFDSGMNAIDFNTYLGDYPKHNEPTTQVINLCDTSRYLSQGYYCSLLAEARSHKVLPSVKTINSLRSQGDDLLITPAPNDHAIFNTDHDVDIIICMGKALNEQFQFVATRVFHDYPSPLLIARVSIVGTSIKVNVSRISISKLTEDERAAVGDILEQSTHRAWQKKRGNRKSRWDVAILVDKKEVVPPSNPSALKMFVKAGQKLGMRVELVTADELAQLNHFDALFIRETTAIDHHTYQLAYEAEQQGLVVLDDSDSILRCCNKVFLHDAFSYKKVPSLKTVFVNEASELVLDNLETQFTYPIVLKMPESSFSRGVFKATDRNELAETLTNLLQDSAIVLAQEYLYTDYDWRIGVLNGKALFACRYYMAHKHWQIYNHGSKRHFSGGFDAIATFEVPRKVLQAALKAAAAIGDGLYGIDVKELNGQAYVLEVNDNPNIDHGIEDDYLGEELYMQVMGEFLRRLEARGRH